MHETATVPEPSPEDLLDSTAAGPAAVRGGALRVGAFLAGTLLALLATAVLFRHLGVDQTGRYSLAVSLVAIVAGVTDLGLTAIGVRELSIRAGASRAALASNLLGLRIVLSIAGVLAIVIFSGVAGYGATLTAGVALAGFGLILQSIQSTLAISLISDLRLGWVAAFELLRSFLSTVLILALVAADASLVAFLAVTIPAAAIPLALNAWMVRGRIPLRPSFHPREWRAIVRDVIPYSVAVAAGTLYFYLAVVLVSLVSSARVLGYFSVSARVIQVLLAIPVLAVGAAFPIFSRAARDDRARLAYSLGKVFEVCLMLGVLVSLSLAIGSSIVIEVVGGSEFSAAATLLAIQGIGLGASFCGSVWSNGLLSLGRYRSILAVNLLALFVGGLMVAVLVSVDGARGAAIGTAAGELMLALANAVALSRADASLRPPLRILPRVALAGGLAAATTLIDLPDLASVALAAVVYVVVLLVSGAVPRELLEAAHLVPRAADATG
jgi:O-antigen/teichoic acid export membrane protein